MPWHTGDQPGPGAMGPQDMSTGPTGPMDLLQGLAGPGAVGPPQGMQGPAGQGEPQAPPVFRDHRAQVRPNCYRDARVSRTTGQDGWAQRLQALPAFGGPCRSYGRYRTGWAMGIRDRLADRCSRARGRSGPHRTYRSQRCYRRYRHWGIQGPAGPGAPVPAQGLHREQPVELQQPGHRQPELPDLPE